MCGIAGVLDLRGRPVEPDDVRPMSRAIAHRGPDDEGEFIDGPVGLAHRRLSVIDLSDAARQPMADAGQVLVYNGELYNYRELRSELAARGHRFRSSGDTEVVLRAYREWGPECVGRFDGMFAFAVWDASARRVFLARDRFGIKPLYYTIAGGRFLFASEVKSLLAAGIPRSVDPEALAEYFTFQNVFSDRTLFAGVRLLPPGHVMEVSEDGVRLRRYWDLEFDPKEGRSEEEWAADVRDAVSSAVRSQLVADVPLGSYLSGGMDSASLVAAASREMPEIATFTAGFDMSSVSGIELVFDEREDAELVSRRFGTRHREIVLHAGDMARVLPRLIWHLEDLRVGTCYQNFYAASLAAKSVRVALAGTGGDEVFAGYPWRYELIADAADERTFDELYYSYWTRLVPDEEKPAFFTDSVWADARHHRPFDVYRAVVSRASDLDPVNRALYFEAKTFLHGLLVVEDRLSMASGLEVRVPFLDNDLIELASRIPSGLKHANGRGKHILRAAMRGVLPDAIVDNPKQGFSPPEGSWYRGPSMAYVHEILLDPRTLDRGFFRPEYTRRIIGEHANGRRNHRLLIWSLLCFEWWNRLFMDPAE